MDFPFLFFAALIFVILALFIGFPFIAAAITNLGLTGTSGALVGVLGLLLAVTTLWALGAPLFHL